MFPSIISSRSKCSYAHNGIVVFSKKYNNYKSDDYNQPLEHRKLWNNEDVMFSLGFFNFYSDCCTFKLTIENFGDYKQLGLCTRFWVERKDGRQMDLDETSTDFVLKQKTTWYTSISRTKIADFTHEQEFTLWLEIIPVPQMCKKLDRPAVAALAQSLQNWTLCQPSDPDVEFEVEDKTEQLALSTVAETEDDFRELLWRFHLNGQFNDLRIDVDGEKLKVSRNVLAAESTFFRSELGKMDGKSEIVIHGLSCETAKSTIEFVYRGRLDGDFDRQAGRLFGAAVQLGISKLRNQCIESLKRLFTPANSADLVVLAVEYENVELMEFVGRFLGSSPQNQLEFLFSAQMRSLFSTNSDLYAKLVEFCRDIHSGV